MSERPHTREIDHWLKWVAILGPFIGFTFGIPAGAIAVYKSMQDQGRRVILLEGFKERQDAFNQEVVQSIARLQEITRRIR